MRELFYLSNEKFERIKPFFPRSHGIPRVDDITDRGYDAARFREALLNRGTTPRIPSGKNRKQPVFYDKNLYKRRHKIEIMFGRLKDWRKIAMRYDRCMHTFHSAICLAFSVFLYLN